MQHLCIACITSASPQAMQVMQPTLGVTGALTGAPLVGMGVVLVKEGVETWVAQKFARL
jgi:hypothetical protein